MTSSPNEPLPLGRIVAATKQWVERLGQQWVEGQLIEIKRRPNSKWHFLTLRDRLAQVSASLVLPSEVLDAAGPLTPGMTVVAQINPRVSERNASLNFSCTDLRPIGEGRLLAQLEQRKQLLRAEGLFEARLKKRLPRLPRMIGVITGAGSAAERDVIENVRRRWPAARLEIRHALVQGTEAAEQVARALAELDRLAEVEVIVIARGGGSLEDLLPFSDELLVRAVHAARTPVVSAIGHESDTPLLDFVADVRASTPTDAARRVVPDMADEVRLITEARSRMAQSVLNLVRTEQRHLDELRRRPSLADPLYGFDLRHQQVQTLQERLNRAVDAQLRQERTAVHHALERIRAMSPRSTLQRGYAILADGSGSGVTSVDDVETGEELLVYLADGQLDVEVRQIRGRSADQHPEEDTDE